MSQSGGFFASSGNAVAPKASTRSIRSVTIKQMQSLEVPLNDEPFMLDGAPVQNVIIVGLVKNIQTAQTKTLFDVQDVTGSAELQMFDQENMAIPIVQVGQYARFFCYLRHYAGRKNFTISAIQKDFGLTYVLYHEMEALRQHLHFTGRKPLTDGIAPPSNSAGDSVVVDPASLKGRIMALISAAPAYEGVFVDTLQAELGYDGFTIKKELDELNHAGLVIPIEENCYMKV